MINSGLSQLGILKFLWAKGQDGEWRIHDLKGLTLRPRPGSEPDFFTFESKMEMLTNRPLVADRYGWLTSFGPTDFLVKQSIVPVVSWVDRKSTRLNSSHLGISYAVFCLKKK